jgi:hypothetical protein
VTDEKGEGFGRKRPWPIFKVIYRNLPVGSEENTKVLRQDSWSPGLDLNPGPPKYDTGVLTPRPRRSVRNIQKLIRLYKTSTETQI